jgi:hypothetical protein
VLWGYISYILLSITLLCAHHTETAFGLLFLLPIGLGIFLSYRDKLIGESGRVRIEADRLDLINEQTGEQATWPFQQLQSYRILLAKGSMGLQLQTKSGEKFRIAASYTAELVAMIKAFEQALREYNLSEETTILRKKEFFERPVSTKVLLGLFAVASALILWGVLNNITPFNYVVPIILVLLPYLSLWAMFSDKR